MNAPLHGNGNGNAPELDPRVSPVWDRWQNLRTPETVDEAMASLRLVALKIAALERAADREPNPDRATALRYSAARWADQRVGLEWALAVLQAGESPLHRELAALRQRYGDLLRTVTLSTDAAALIGHLQRKLQRNDEAREALAMELMHMEHAHDRLRVEMEDARRQLGAKSEQVAALNRRLNGGDRG